MKLHWSPKSPYVRKVMICAHELGLHDQIECIRSVATMRSINPAIMRDNPLGKIPAMVLADGRKLTDSRVICEYLDHLGQGQLFPADPDCRWQALAWQALGDGLLDVLILWRNEREKPAGQQTPEWLCGFDAKVSACLDRFESESDQLGLAAFSIGQISIGCALSYADFRFETLDWRNGRPKLAAWHRTFCARPSALATEVSDG